MLNFSHPEIFADVIQMAVGVRAYFRENESILEIKASARALLAAKARRRIKFYFAPVVCADINSFCMLTAFLDNDRSPLLIWTPLYDEQSTSDLIRVLSDNEIHIYFLDEKNRPWLSYAATNLEHKKFKAFAKKLKFAPGEFSKFWTAKITDQASAWFFQSGPREDRRSFEIILHDTLFPDDIAVIDVSRSTNDFYGSFVRHAALEYADAGARQEPDMAEEFANLFGGTKTLLNPLKIPNMEELCDTLVLGQQANYFIQLKSSPNTEKIQARDLGQTRNAIIQHVKKAVIQTRDCLDYINEKTAFEISLKTDRKFRASVPQLNHNMIFLIVTHEVISDDLGLYAEPLLDLAESKKKVVCHLSESALYQYLHYSDNENDFFDLILNDFRYLLNKRRVYDQRVSVKRRIEDQRG